MSHHQGYQHYVDPMGVMRNTGNTVITAVSKLTRKYQATVPAAVREALDLNSGDRVAFEIEDGRVSLRKAFPADLAFAGAVEDTLGEWATEEDQAAYGEL